MCDSPELLNALAKIEKLLEKQSLRRDYIDMGYSVSDTQGFVLDYKGYRYLYVFSGSALTFKIGNTATIAIAANTWTPLQFREGHRIFTSGQATPVNVLIRATDDLFAILTASSVTQGTSPWVVSVSNANANGQATMVNSSPVVLASDQSAIPVGAADNAPFDTNQGTIGANTLRTVAGGAGTGAKTNVASANTSTNILAANTNRKGAMIYNDSTQLLYLDLTGGTASATSYSVQVPSQQFYELPGPDVYNGLITGIWVAANGNARVTEWT